MSKIDLKKDRIKDERITKIAELQGISFEIALEFLYTKGILAKSSKQMKVKSASEIKK
jgi:hypothetical protein